MFVLETIFQGCAAFAIEAADWRIPETMLPDASPIFRVMHLQRSEASGTDLEANMAKRILVIKTTGGLTYLQTIEECSFTTIVNAERAGYKIASQRDKKVSEEIINRPYEDKENAANAAKSIGLLAFTYQRLAAFTQAD